MADLLRAQNCWKKYGASEDAVLRGASLVLNSGDSVAMLGASGSGKSTLLHCLGLLDHLDQGELSFKGESLGEFSSKRSADFRLRNMGFIFQFHHLIAELTVEENVWLPASLMGNRDRAYALELLDAVGLKDKARRFPWQLSGGEQQRVSVARALVNRPELVLTDEATGNLDASRALEMIELLLGLCRRFGTTVLSVTHDETLSTRYARRVRLKDGQIWDFLETKL